MDEKVRYVPLTEEEIGLIDTMLYSAVITGWLSKKERAVKRSLRRKLAQSAEIAALERMLGTGEKEGRS